MKVILFTDSLGPGGAQRQLVGLGALLLESGVEARIITYYDYSFYKPFLDKHGVVNEVLHGADKKWKRLWILCSYLRDSRPDCVVAYQETPSLLACCAKLLVGKFRLIVSERSTTQTVSIRDRIRFLMYQKADLIVPNSFTQADYLRVNYHRLNDKIYTITNFVDLNTFKPEYHLRNTIPCLLVVGSIIPSKNTITFIKACKRLVERGYHFTTILLGRTEQPNPYLEEVSELVTCLGLGGIVFIQDKTTDIVPYYQLADYYCIPSLFEGTPNALCEAISCGLPVAASKVCDNYLYVKEGLNGALFDPSSPDSIADALQTLFDLSDNEYYSYCIESRELAKKLLSKDVFLEKYLEAINR